MRGGSNRPKKGEGSYAQGISLAPGVRRGRGGRVRSVVKAVLPYDASPGVRRMLADLDPALVRTVVVAEADMAGLRRELADAEVLLHVLAPVTREIMAAAPGLKLVQKIGVGVDAIDGRSALRVHRLIDAILESARTGVRAAVAAERP